MRIRRPRLWRWAMVLIVVAVIGALSASPDAAAAVPRHPRPADVPASCLVGYCIVSVNPIGDGAIECEGTGLVEVLDVEVAVGAKVPYSRPYVTAEASQSGGSAYTSGVAYSIESGEGPQGLHFVLRLPVSQPGTYNGTATGEGAGISPTFAPDFAFTFTVGGPSPISVAQGDATCEDEQPSRYELVESAVMGSLLESPALGSIVKALEIEFGEDAVTAERAAHELLELWDQVHSAIALSEVLRRLHDPPDDNFTTLATYSALPPDAPIDGLPPAQQAAAEALFTQAETAIGYERAFLTSYERAWGAENAHAQTAYDTQMNAAAGFAMHAAEALAKLPALADAAQHAILPHPAGVLLTDEEISTYQQGVLAGTSDPVLIAGLESWGLSAANARDAELGAAAVDASSAAGQDVTSIFSAPADAFSAAATQLEAFATFATHRQVPAPIVAGVSPSEGAGAGGTLVTITGTDLGEATAVHFGDAAAAFTCATGSCTATTPPGTETVDVTVTTAGGTSATVPADEYVYDPAPSISGVSPAAAAAGTRVTVNGESVGDVTGISFGGQAATDVECTVDACTAIAPPGNGTVDVTAQSPEGVTPISDADRFTYLNETTQDVPSGDFEPGNGVPEEPSGYGEVTAPAKLGAWTVALVPGSTGTGGVEIVDASLAQPYTGAQFLKFGLLSQGDDSAPAQIQQTVAVTPSHSYELDFALSGQTQGDPAIKQLNVSLGDISQPFTFDISGHTTQSQGWVRESLTATTCSTALPVTLAQVDAGTRGPEVDDVRLIDLGPADPNPCLGAPVVTKVTPASGPDDGGTPVTITGTNLTDATSIHFGTVPASGVSCTATSCSATTPAGTGTVDVTVTGPAGTSATSTADHYTYLTPPPPTVPTVTKVTPASGPDDGGTPVTITGTNLTDATSIHFGTVPASAVSCTATSCSATTPAGHRNRRRHRHRHQQAPPPPPPPTTTPTSPTPTNRPDGHQGDPGKRPRRRRHPGHHHRHQPDRRHLHPLRNRPSHAPSPAQPPAAQRPPPPEPEQSTSPSPRPAGTSATSTADHYTYLTGGQRTHILVAKLTAAQPWHRLGRASGLAALAISDDRLCYGMVWTNFTPRIGMVSDVRARVPVLRINLQRFHGHPLAIGCVAISPRLSAELLSHPRLFTVSLISRTCSPSSISGRLEPLTVHSKSARNSRASLDSLAARAAAEARESKVPASAVAPTSSSRVGGRGVAPGSC